MTLLKEQPLQVKHNFQELNIYNCTELSFQRLFVTKESDVRCIRKCKCIRNWPLPIGAFQDQCKQTMINKHN